MNLQTILKKVCYDFNHPFMVYEEDTRIITANQYEAALRLNVIGASCFEAHGSRISTSTPTAPHQMLLKLSDLPFDWRYNPINLIDSDNNTSLTVEFEGTFKIYTDIRLISSILDYIKSELK